MIAKLRNDERHNKRIAVGIKVQYGAEVQRTFPLDTYSILWIEDEKRNGGFIRDERTFYEQVVKVSVVENRAFKHDCNFVINCINLFAHNFTHI